jgi:hypothetical protein
MHEPPLEVLALDRDDLVALERILAKVPIADATQPNPPAVSVTADRPTAPVARPPRRRVKQRI